MLCMEQTKKTKYKTYKNSGEPLSPILDNEVYLSSSGKKRNRLADDGKRYWGAGADCLIAKVDCPG